MNIFCLLFTSYFSQYAKAAAILNKPILFISILLYLLFSFFSLSFPYFLSNAQLIVIWLLLLPKLVFQGHQKLFLLAKSNRHFSFFCIFLDLWRVLDAVDQTVLQTLASFDLRNNTFCFLSLHAPLISCKLLFFNRPLTVGIINILCFRLSCSINMTLVIYFCLLLQPQLTTYYFLCLLSFGPFTPLTYLKFLVWIILNTVSQSSIYLIFFF